MEISLKNILLEDGTDIIYFNKWSGFENKEIASCFKCMSKTEVNNIKVGDKIWTDDEPYYHHGKVYGLTLHEVKKIESLDGDEKRIHTTTGYFSSKYAKVSKVIDEEKLARLIEANPKCLTNGD